MGPIGYAVSSERSEHVHGVASAFDVPSADATSFRTATRRVSSWRGPGASGATASQGPVFSPAGLLSPETTWPGTTACAVAATPSNGVPHHPPTRLHSSCSADTLRCDGRLWPPAPTP